jgi:hypothetical protein
MTRQSISAGQESVSLKRELLSGGIRPCKPLKTKGLDRLKACAQ